MATNNALRVAIAGVGTVGALAVTANQDLLDDFFKAAKPLLTKNGDEGGEIHLAMADDANRAQVHIARFPNPDTLFTAPL